MKRYVLTPDQQSWESLVTRPAQSIDDLRSRVQPILDQVRNEGDRALQSLTNRFDRVDLDEFRVSPKEFDYVESRISPELGEAITVAIENIHRFHMAQVQASEWIETFPGVRCQRRMVPIDRVGLYVPGGSAPLFSTLLMLAVPAQIAGCGKIVVCTPPQPDGLVHPAILFSAQKLGLKEIYKVGGAQAIAAMAFGTASVPRVDKIFGPGNAFVTVAKQLVQLGGVAIDMPAGPSEVAIIADENANPAFIAADLLSQAEHGADSQVVCISPSSQLLDRVEDQLAVQMEALPRKETAAASLQNSIAVETASLEEAMEFSNAYAPEHLILHCRDAVSLADRVRNAGSVFIGPYSPESAGDYASGTNHTLPTAGFARAYSGVSIDSFVKKITFQEISPVGLKGLGPHVEAMARAEGLEAHAAAVSIRLSHVSQQETPESDTELADRTALVHRKTNETDIRISLNLDGSGKRSIHTGLGFFDHLLDQLIRHSRSDAVIYVQGDLHIDEHHTIEDTALALGAAFNRALGDKKGIERYGFLLPMDDALVQAAIDFSGRPWLVWDATFSREKIGDVPTEMFYHFFKSFCDAARCNLNLKIEGNNEHHMIEAAFKAVGKSIRMAVRRDPSHMEVPSTKGVL